MPTVYMQPQGIAVQAPGGSNLLQVLARAGFMPDAPCGGNGICGKCLITVNGESMLACRVTVEQDLYVQLPDRVRMQILMEGHRSAARSGMRADGAALAFDIGTTTVVCYLLECATGEELASAAARNPQAAYGADVISRVQSAITGSLDAQSEGIRDTMVTLARQVCDAAGCDPASVRVVCPVGNPAMQQLFLGIRPDNLVQIPFESVLRESRIGTCAEKLPICPDAKLLTVPDISGYVGADTVGCILSTRIHEGCEPVLLVDIGTNGEMVLGDRNGLVACATAAGPALEGANISCGMRAESGAIDHVRIVSGQLQCSVLDGAQARGICGSGLIDAVACGLELGLLNKRGRILTEDRVLHLTDRICLTQEDIRQVQLAKGAIRAGIVLLAKKLGLELSDISRVLLAGAFGTYMDPASACRIGMLPEELAGRITAVGNAAGEGAKLLALDEAARDAADHLVRQIRCIELADMQEFPRTFAKSMEFREGRV